MDDPINKSVSVPLDQQAAFKLFTSGIDTWWPGATFSVSAEGNKPPRKIQFASHKDGLITEETHDGKTVTWGKVLAYDSGKYLAFSWYPGKTEAEATMVTVTFTPHDGGTRCDLQHGGFDVLGPMADAVSTSYLSGWDMVLGCLVAAADQTSAPTHVKRMPEPVH